MSYLKEKWGFILGAVLLMALVLNRHFYTTILRYRAIHQAKQEYSDLSTQSDKLQVTLRQLNDNPGSYETLVRKELGYLRPGEKEIRFVKAR